ncbi:hypothetical protein C1752_03771 [Acaryochloris thomasi RCC1774]|uniref:Metallo-beta-lactamase domain-containing protein n=1 Tax=Acaryochloris thomasi RCC1774 TaxID=1764569 RepID=A0A2W1JL63_9CYAN|nr:MBL fold metallo-hydrolase [Acaryochloris thomasi]PZD72185.1 hypothetical protein C1752_03771 [Acaryochloris thomasi RCC1774]
MVNYICITCGTQFADTSSAPERCPICEDDRQYVGHDGQQWTTLPELRKEHHNRIEQQEENLYGIGTEPSFAIGQRALLIQSKQGNVLWDCISLIDEQTVDKVNELGGVDAIALSHPHFYASAVEWANAFDAEIYLHEADRQWMMRPDPRLQFWKGNVLELKGLTLINIGGHFEGGTVCHWASGAHGAGGLLTGDLIQVVPAKHWVSFMYSYANLIPLSASKVRHIANSLEPYSFDRLYGAWWDAVITVEAKTSVKCSAERYIRAIEDAA